MDLHTRDWCSRKRFYAGIIAERRVGRGAIREEREGILVEQDATPQALVAIGVPQSDGIGEVERRNVVIVRSLLANSSCGLLHVGAARAARQCVIRSRAALIR